MSALSVVSSKATQALLAELTKGFSARTGNPVSLESIGGVDVVKRVRGGAVFDVVVLAEDAINSLIDAGHLVSASKRDFVVSGLAVAVQRGAPFPDLQSEEAVRLALLRARSIGRSTGPSGVQLVRLLERWGIADEVQPRMVVAPPGVPVGELVASGRVELGFQQFSELIHIQGLDIVGPLPEPIQIVTTFSAAVTTSSSQFELAQAFIGYLSSPATAEAKRRQGMEPASTQAAR